MEHSRFWNRMPMFHEYEPQQTSFCLFFRLLWWNMSRHVSFFIFVPADSCSFYFGTSITSGIHRSSLYFHEVNPIIFWNQEKLMKKKTEEEQHQLHYLGFSIHQEVASDSFCFLINSSWLLVFILFLFLHPLGSNLYWWKGIHFS